MMKITSRSNALIAGVLVCLCLAGAGVSIAQQRFEDVTDVVVVEVPVQVLRNGEPVRGLTAEDFTVTAGRKKQDISSFDVVDLTLTDASGAPVEVPTTTARRHFLFFFDLSFSDPGSIVRARQAAIELVDKGLHPSDLAAVGSYSRTTGSRLILGFTPDRDQVKLAIETLGLPQLVESRRDPLGLVFNDMLDPALFSETVGAQVGGGAGGAKPDVDAEIQQLLVMMEGSAQRASDTRDILALTSSMTGMANMMNAIPGRKHVVFLSEGFDSQLLLGTQGATAQEQREIERMNEAAAAGRVWEVDSQDRFGDTNMQNQLTGMLEEFVRADCTIQAVDIAGLRGTEVDVTRARGTTQDSLFIMANDTGGEFFYNFNNLYDAMGKMLERTSVTYVLSFQVKDVKFDGRFHKLKVALREGGKGVDIVHRPGFYAPRPYGDVSKIEQQLITSSAIMGAPGGDIFTSVLATAFPSTPDAAYIPVLIEIDGPSLMANTEGEVLPTEIYTYAISSKGDVEDYFVQTLGLSLPKVRPALELTGFKYWGHFELPPDRYTIRVLVRNGYSGAWGVQVFALTVPDLEKAEALILPPLFPEPQGKWLLGREDPEEASSFDYPFTMKNAPFIPAARPTVESGQSANISLVAYNLSGGIPDARGSLVAMDGSEVGEVEILLIEQEMGSDANLIRYVATCTIPTIDAGPYKLKVTLQDPESGEQQTSSIDLQVRG